MQSGPTLQGKRHGSWLVVAIVFFFVWKKLQREAAAGNNQVNALFMSYPLNQKHNLLSGKSHSTILSPRFWEFQLCPAHVR